MDLVKAAADKNGTFEGKNAVEYQTLLKKQNGWRAQVQNTQKAWVAVAVPKDTSIIGWDKNAKLAGVTLGLNSASNIHSKRNFVVFTLLAGLSYI
jgi:pectate lyase